MKQKLEFINISSHIHKINPSIKLLYLLFYTIICFLPNNLDYILLSSFILVTYLTICSRISIKNYIKTILKFKLVIIAMYIIFASFNFTLLKSSMLVLSFIFGTTLYSLIIYTTHPYLLALGLYDIFKYFNILGINKNKLFIMFYNLVYFKKDYENACSNIIDSLEIKGKIIRNKNIISRICIKLDLLPKILKDVKNIRKKRTKVMLRNKFNVNKIISKIHFIDIIYLLMFILLIGIYISKVI